MKLKEIERIRAALKVGNATKQDCQTAVDEAIRFHHKVSELQERLIQIQQKCEMELNDIEAGKPVTSTHYALVLDYIMDVLEECRHIKAA